MNSELSNTIGTNKKVTVEKMMEIKISSVTPQDSAEFVCTGTNPYGTHTHVTQLVVQGE